MSKYQFYECCARSMAVLGVVMGYAMGLALASGFVYFVYYQIMTNPVCGQTIARAC